VFFALIVSAAGFAAQSKEPTAAENPPELSDK
jgi:hypothetical protein